MESCRRPCLHRCQVCSCCCQSEGSFSVSLSICITTVLHAPLHPYVTSPPSRLRFVWQRDEMVAVGAELCQYPIYYLDDFNSLQDCKRQTDKDVKEYLHALHRNKSLSQSLGATQTCQLQTRSASPADFYTPLPLVRVYLDCGEPAVFSQDQIKWLTIMQVRQSSDRVTTLKVRFISI